MSYYDRSLVAFRLQIALFLIALFLAAFYSSVPKPTNHSIMVGFVIVEGLLFLGSWISGFMVSGPEDIRSIFYSASSLAESVDRCSKREDYIVEVLREKHPVTVRKSVKLRVKHAIDLEKGRMDAAGGIGALFPAGALAVSALLFASDLPPLWKGILSGPSFVVALLAITSKLGFVDLQQMVFFLERAEDGDKKGRDAWGNNDSDELGQVGNPNYDPN